MELKDKIDLGLKIFAAGIAAFGVWKFFADQALTRDLSARAESLRVVRDFSGSSMIDAREELTRFWRNYPEFISSTDEHNVVSNREYRGFVRSAMKTYSGAEQLSTALFRLNDYYETLYLCRLSNICDAQLLDTFRCDTAVAHQRYYADFFNELNRAIGGDDFGVSLASYATSCGEEEAKD